MFDVKFWQYELQSPDIKILETGLGLNFLKQLIG